MSRLDLGMRRNIERADILFHSDQFSLHHIATVLKKRNVVVLFKVALFKTFKSFQQVVKSSFGFKRLILVLQTVEFVEKVVATSALPVYNFMVRVVELLELTI